MHPSVPRTRNEGGTNGAREANARRRVRIASGHSPAGGHLSSAFDINVFKPRSAQASLRRKIIWLKSVRYFVQYYPPTGFVTSASLFSASGRLLQRTSGGELFKRLT